jgi:2,4-dienoyl-CoA reductase (NADPH2)
VTVVGGGPAGLKAAVIAARRGHRVTLYERQPELGGQVNLAVKVTNRAEFGDLVRNLLHELHQLDVTVRTGVTADADMVLAGQPDAVVIATGSTPDRNAFPGADGPEVADVTDILAGRVTPGKRVMIIDRLGFHEATSVAEYLAEQGCRVEIVTPTLYVGQDLGVTLDLENWYRRARQLNIVCTPNVSVLNAANGLVTAVHNYSGQIITFDPVDTIVLAVQRRADAGLYFALKGRVPELHRIGDALAPRRAHAAIIEGERVGRAL